VTVFIIVISLIVLLCIALVIAIARERGPGPVDTAVSYEYAWDHLDFESIWTMSGRELRDGLGRKEYVAAKRAAYANQRALGALVADVAVADLAAREDVAVVITSVALHDGSVVHNRAQLARRQGRWQVVDYRLAGDGTPSHAAAE
jgi:hypothetical protein